MSVTRRILPLACATLLSASLVGPSLSQDTNDVLARLAPLIAASAGSDRQARLRLDQAARRRGAVATNSEFEAARVDVRRVDRANAALIRRVVYATTWTESPDERLRGDVFLLVQHSNDLDLQEAALRQIEPLALRGEFSGQEYALLFDRVAIKRGRPQRFGSQLTCVGGRYVMDRTEELPGLAERPPVRHGPD